MSVKEMLNQSFPPISMEDWVEKSEESLKGRKIETLAKETFEAIKLKPLYTRKDDKNTSQFPAQSDFRRGIHALGYLNQDWEVAQTLKIKEGALKESLTSAFSNGQTAISFEITEDTFNHVKELEEFHGKYSYSLNAKKFHASLIKEISDFSLAQEGTGYIGKDPIAFLAERGAAKDTVEDEYNELFETVKRAVTKLPRIRTILVDSIPYHNGGANAVQELAIALSTGVTHLEELTKRSLSVEAVLSKLVFQFSIGSNFFMEVAKLRAARVLWSKLTEAYGVEEGLQGMVIAGSTSFFTKTVYDPYVNMLRAGNEAFAAVLGGVQYLHVSPFNEPEESSTDFSERIARNTQLILKEEALLTKTIDPAGGSWYVEHLTTELAERAWELFLAVDEKGGVLTTLRSGFLQSEISRVRAEREETIASRKQTIVGTNKYADIRGDHLQASILTSCQESGFIEPIPQSRLAESYENLRKRASQLKTPAVGLIGMGKLKSHKARVDFVKGFLAPGGIEGVTSGEMHSLDNVLAFIEQTEYSFYCLCGTNEQYGEIGLKWVEQINQAYPNIQLYIAGLPEEKELWMKAGIKDFIHVKSNCHQTLALLLDEMEVDGDE